MIRKSSISDVDIILSLLEDGRKKMVAEGNLNQWEVGYPSHEQVLRDIDKGVSYLIFQEGKAVATFVLMEGPDPTYQYIYKGNWLNDDPYAVIHRLASTTQVHGIMNLVLDFAFSKTKTIRIDTHEDNLIMQKLLKKNGFTYCGVIYLENGSSRLAFQKTIKE